MADANQFAKRMAKLAFNIEANSSETVQKAALAIDAQVVISTPVDTNRARSNWLVGINGPITEETDDFPKGKKGSGGAAATRAAKEKGKRQILKHKPGQSIYISNNVKYINDLNRGTSIQAPAMFVQMGVLAGVKAVKGVKLLKRG